MNFRKYLIGTFVAIAAFAGCQEKPEDLGDPRIDLDQTEIQFGKEVSQQSLSFVSTRAWSIKDLPAWLAAEPAKGEASLSRQTVVLSALANAGNDRKAVITLSCGMAKEYVTVSQQGEKGPAIKNDGTKAHPYTVAEANELASQLSDGDETTLADKFVVGKVSTIINIDVTFGNAEYKISDDGTASGEFYIYRGYSLGGKKFKSDTEIKVGDEVVVFGTIINFKGNTIEMTTGSKIVSLNGEDAVEVGPVVPITGTNILSNGSFEDWTGTKPVDWDFTNGNASLKKVSDAKDGSNACEIAGVSDGNRRLMSKAYTLRAGTYQIQAYLKGDGQYRLGYGKLTNGKIVNTDTDYIYLNEPAKTSSDWNLCTVEFKLEEQTQISVIVMNSKNGKGAPVLADDVRLVTADGGLVEEEEKPVETVTFSGLVVATSKVSAFVQTEDGLKYIYDESGAMTAEVGDDVTVTGTVEEYNGVPEITDITLTVNSKGNPVSHPEAVVLDGVAVNSYETLFGYVSFRGKLSVSGSGDKTYYNLSIPNSQRTGSLVSPVSVSDELKGKYVDVTGYFTGISGKVYFNVLFTELKLSEDQSDPEMAGAETLELKEGETVRLDLTNEDIVAALSKSKETATTYGDFSIGMPDVGDWTGNICIQNTLKYIQMRDKSKSRLNSPDFGHPVKRIVVKVNEKTTTGRSVYVMPVVDPANLPDDKDTQYGNSVFAGNLGYAAPKGKVAELLELEFSTPANAFTILVGGGATYIDSISVFY